MLGDAPFADRPAAGAALARVVGNVTLQPPLLVLALPRGGVPVAYELARDLHAPLDVLVVRKIGMPGQPELAIGAIASGNITVREPGIESYLPDGNATFERIARHEHQELERREQAYRKGLPPLELRGRTVVLVDDGLATGSTMLAAVRAARAAGAQFIIVAAPVASHEAMQLLRPEADRLIVLKVPTALVAIGAWYEDFDQVADSEVQQILQRARDELKSGCQPPRTAP